MTDKVLLNSGYKEIKIDDEHKKIMFPNAIKIFQKKIKNKQNRIKYIIQVVHNSYDDCADYSYIILCDTNYSRIALEIFDVYLPLTIEEIEEEIDKIWTRCDFKYHES